MLETKESYEEQIKRILGMGSIREIANDRAKLLEILAYNGDRHMTAFLYELLDNGLKNGAITPEDLEANFRSSWFARATIELKGHLGRNPYPFEIGDKINYASLLSDPASQIAMYTQPEIIGAIAGTRPDPGSQYSYCEISFPSLSPEARVAIAEEVLIAGNREKAIELLESLRSSMERERKFDEESKKRVSGQPQGFSR